MKSPQHTFLSRLDNTLRWTGIPARVADQHRSDDSSGERKYRLLRWVPIWPIAFSCAVFVISLIWPPLLDGVRPGAIIAILVSFMGAIMAMVPSIHTDGPLGKPSYEDDEREEALRKDAFLVCLGLLACLNCLGQPLLMVLAHVQNWQAGHRIGVVASAFLLNVTLFGCVPTLYASWKLKQLPRE